mgnify:CR=1 FL=1
MTESKRDLIVKLLLAVIAVALLQLFFVPWVTQPGNFSKFMNLAAIAFVFFGFFLILSEIFERLTE